MPKPKTKKKIAKDSSSGGHLGDITVRQYRKGGQTTIRYKAEVISPENQRHPLLIETTKEGYQLLLNDLAEWARWQPPSPDPSFEALAQDDWAYAVLWETDRPSPLRDILKLPLTRSTHKPNPAKKRGASDQSLRRTKAAIKEYREMIQEDAVEIGAYLLEWARRQDKTGSPTSLLEQVFARAKKAEYPQKTFYRDGKLIHELVAAFLFELKIRSDWIGPDLFERANLELPMVRQLDYINNIKEPRSRDSAKSGGIEYFSSMSRTNRQRTNQLNKAAKFMPNPYLNKQIQAILRKSLSK